jgi:hypothetical protein
MKQVNDFFQLTAQKTLYHYTSIGSLLGIISSRKIWASHAYYLNDSKEVLHACEGLQRILPDLAKNNEQNNEREFLGQFGDWLNSFKGGGYHFFIFSLSEESSLLSQWRSYTPHGKGVSLGFSPAILNQVLQSTGFRIAQCLYRAEEHKELMLSLVEKMLITFRQEQASLNTTHHHPSQKYHEFLEKFRGDILQVFSIIKHPAFSEELEWRIISPYFAKYTIPEIKFREGASMLMPYYEISLPEDQILFEKVILGPSEHANLSMNALSAFLSNKKVCNYTINSTIPYRKWQ